MRIFVTGVNGQLGYDVVEAYKSRFDIVGTDIDELDITNQKAVKEYFKDNYFDIFVHCAAYTNVEKAEEDKELCYKVNVTGTKLLLEEAKKQNAIFIYFSTDYVFDGTKDKNLFYGENEKVSPLNVYGDTKEQGEQVVRTYDKHYVLRISWVYGLNGHNFIKTMLRIGKDNELNIISDQIGSPTYTKDVARNLEQFMNSSKYGTYHFTNTGMTSWADYARYIFSKTGRNVIVNDIAAKEYKVKAVRPLNSQLSQEKLVKNGFDQLPDWKDAVDRYLKEIGEIK